MPFTSNREFVTLCYERYLRREPVSAEVDGWVHNLVTGVQTRLQVEGAFLGSDEFFQGQAQGNPTEMIAQWYLRVLGVNVDAAGSQTWLARYGALGGNRIQLAAEFLAAAGYTTGGVRALHEQHPHLGQGAEM